MSGDRLRARLWRAALVGGCLFAAAPRFPLHADQSPPPACSVGGTITSGRMPLPGVVVSVVDADGRVADTSTSALDGSYTVPSRSPATTR